PPTHNYPVSLHDALPIWKSTIDAAMPAIALGYCSINSLRGKPSIDHLPAPTVREGERKPLPYGRGSGGNRPVIASCPATRALSSDRKSTRLNSSHQIISY